MKPPKLMLASDTLANRPPPDVAPSSICPISNECSRPFWSVMIPTFNGERYLRLTIESILNQAPSPDEMQIEVVDDCSTQGDIEALVTEIGQGRVLFHRNSKNVGLLMNWEVCIQRARGYWIHILHQDDLVMPGFYDRIKAGIEQAPDIGAAFCRHIYIDDRGDWLFLSDIEERTPGLLDNWIERVGAFNKVQFPAIVVKRRTYETLGGFCVQARSAADWEMWKRIAAHYSVWYEPQPLACFRLHTNSASCGLIQRGDNIADTYKAIEVSRSYLPMHIVNAISNKAQVNYAFHAFSTAREKLLKGEISTAISQLKQGLRYSYKFPNVAKSGVFVFILILLKTTQVNFSLRTLLLHRFKKR